MVEGLRPRTILQAIAEHQVTWLFAIPTVFELLIKSAPSGFSSTLRVGETGGAVVTKTMVLRAEAALGCKMLPIWGCTESTGVVLYVPPWEDGRPLEMLGKPVKHYAVRVHDPDPTSGVGELCVSGPAVVSGYSGLPDVTARKFIGPWYHTGDLVREEADGYLRFMGRQEEMIKVGGIKVYLREVEHVLSQLPQIAQVVVVSAQDPVRGEVPRAMIVLKPGVSLTTREIMAHCRVTMRPEMIPRMIEIWDTIPKSPSGKVDRRAAAARVSHKLALGVNSMLIADRPLDEVFRLATGARQRHAFPVFVDLRSRRSPASDPDNTWSVAHSNADFDLADPGDVDRAVALSRKHGIQIAATSAYLGACQPGDREYGIAVIDQAYRLAVAAPSATLTLRVLGGDLWARARGLQEPWHVVRQQLREESVETILHWEAHTRQRAEETGRKVLLGLELHHGQYLSGLHDIHHCCKALAETHWDFVGFLEDPCNRFITSEGDLIGAMDFARMVAAWGGRILGYHIKDVRYLSAWSQFHPQPLQRVGDPVFVWGVHKYAWTPLGEGDMDLGQSLMAARTLSQPPHTWCLVSSEYVRSSRSEDEARAILEDYCRLLQDGRPSPRPS
jgi:sugar phosphate isomerase/epimerase